MFSDEIIIKILRDEDSVRVPFIYQFAMINIIGRILKEKIDNGEIDTIFKE